jgi:prophage regulatory protein
MSDQHIDILIKLPEVCRQSGISKSTIYDLISSASFPLPIKLGRYSRWSQTEVQLWIETQKQERRAA